MLREALQQGQPGLSVPQDTTPELPVTDSPLTLDSASVEVQSAYLEQLVECAPEAISILDDQYRITRINGEFTRMFGYTQEEAVGQRIHSVIVPPDRHSETRWIREVLKQRERVSLETRRQHKNGTLLEVYISAAPVVVGNKQVGSYVLYRDISEQKRTEFLNSALYRIAQKASSAQDLHQFYASIHAIVGELMYARNFYIALFDSAEQLVSFPYFVDEIDPVPAPKKPGRGLTEYVIRTGEPLLCTPDVFDILVQKGKVELIGAPSLDWLGVPLKSGGQTFGVVVVQSYHSEVRYRPRDREVLTFVSQQIAAAIEYKRHEEALRRSEARYRSLVQSAVYGIYRFSREGRFLDVNPALTAMLGYESADEVYGLDARRDVFWDSADYARLMDEFAKSGSVGNVEVRWKRKDGHSIAVCLSGRAVDGSEESGQVFEMIAEDVTERRALEEQFRQAQKMEAVGRLAGGVAHDFNNLLMVIGGYTEVLLEQTAAHDPIHAKIEAIQQAAARATVLTKQLLAFSRKPVLDLKPVDINGVVTDMERLLRPLTGENIELITRLAPDLGRTRADAGQIEHVVMNLVVNSRDAMPKGGKITIETGNVDIDDDLRHHYRYLQPGAYVMLAISDTGIGMDPETQSHIFEPFFTTKEKGKGTGLGLSTVYGIVKQCDGYILPESESGKGTTFRIYLPRIQQLAKESGQVHSAQTASGGSETVLLVEDEDSVRQLVRETLEARGYRVLEADNGDAALQAAESHVGSIHMLITDVVMPGMNGYELSKKLKTRQPGIRMLYLSGYTEGTVVEEDAISPGTAFLQKPFTLHALSRKVREVLGDQQL